MIQGSHQNVRVEMNRQIQVCRDPYLLPKWNSLLQDGIAEDAFIQQIKSTLDSNMTSGESTCAFPMEPGTREWASIREQFQVWRAAAAMPKEVPPKCSGPDMSG
jgi:hypothetical protein